MENRFEKYMVFKKENGMIVDTNINTFKLADESFLLFKELFNNHYGSIYEDENLVSIHTGGWSENEVLICEFEQTLWWLLHYKITESGGHYFFDTDSKANKKWKVVSNSG